MNQREFNDITFNAALARARAAEAADLRVAAAGAVVQSKDVRESLQRALDDNTARVLAQWMGA